MIRSGDERILHWWMRASAFLLALVVLAWIAFVLVQR